jgi:leucyl-tRNA synthetase
VLEHYGTGAVFADAHDKRDFKMAKKYSIPLRTSIKPDDELLSQKVKNLEECCEDEGTLYNSMQFDGLKSAEAKPMIIAWLASKGFAQPKISYKLRDWVFSRQHYWGEPIPMVFCKKCGWQAVLEKDLPVKLPNVKKYQPTDTGESPLSVIEKWVKTECPKCKGDARRETDTMPNWAGSNWYYLRYADAHNSKDLADESAIKYWLPVDWYNGGMEHTTLHLLYSRFIFKFLWDIKAIPTSVGSEPYKKRTSHGMVLGEGGIKMSKSKGNVINPDTIVKQYGADTLRVYEMFMGPFEQMIPWDTKGVVGSRRFVEKIYNLILNKNLPIQSDEGLRKLLHKAIKKVGEDIELMKFNTAVSSMMEFVNAYQTSEVGLNKKDLSDFLKILSPFIPHLTEELWQTKEFSGACCEQKWPKYDPKLIEDKIVLLIVQVNGKVRDKIEIKSGLNQKEVEKVVMKSEKIIALIGKSEVKKIVFIPNKLINIVI